MFPRQRKCKEMFSHVRDVWSCPQHGHETKRSLILSHSKSDVFVLTASTLDSQYLQWLSIDGPHAEQHLESQLGNRHIEAHYLSFPLAFPFSELTHGPFLFSPGVKIRNTQDILLIKKPLFCSKWSFWFFFNRACQLFSLSCCLYTALLCLLYNFLTTLDFDAAFEKSSHTGV